jgi:hypothetical protein
MLRFMPGRLAEGGRGERDRNAGNAGVGTAATARRHAGHGGDGGLHVRRGDALGCFGHIHAED